MSKDQAALHAYDKRRFIWFRSMRRYAGRALGDRRFAVLHKPEPLSTSGRRDDCPSDLTIAITAGNGVLAQCCGTMIRAAQRQTTGHTV
jgi:hypothetical protein